MKIAIISDAHIVEAKDRARQIFLNFLSLQQVANLDYLVLLGDIFDLMAGTHYQYLVNHKDIWLQISKLINQGVKVIYLEGNHDLHLERLWQKLAMQYNFAFSQVEIVRKFKIIGDGPRRIYLSHGDELEGSRSYLRYKRFIHSRFVQFIADFIMPYTILNFFGQRASRKSRGINCRKYSTMQEQQQLKQRYRTIAAQIAKKYQCDYIFLGHSHYMDFFQQDYCYGNCGYLAQDKCYLLYLDGKVEVITLT